MLFLDRLGTVLTASAAAALLTACGSSEGSPGGGSDRTAGRCAPGEVTACACADGSWGQQVCLEDRSYGACGCEPGQQPGSAPTAPNGSTTDPGGTPEPGGTPTEPGGGEEPIDPGMPPPPPPPGDGPTALPTNVAPCPQITEGATLQFLHLSVRIVAAGASDRAGPLLFYWHGTGGFDTAQGAYGRAVIDDIRNQGGLVVEPRSNTPSGGAGANSTGNGVWFYDDFDVADEVLACAMQQINIDTRRIYASGMSAGGLQTTAMSYARSNYIAAVVPFSGGSIILTRTNAVDPSNKFAAMIVHGGPTDTLIINFQDSSNAYHADLQAKGHFSFLCNHGGGHTIPGGIGPSAWQFMQDHPFGASPSPYQGGLPAGFPAYCSL